jgi:post-segregation antitoxin (ccd killing protein)
MKRSRSSQQGSLNRGVPPRVPAGDLQSASAARSDLLAIRDRSRVDAARQFHRGRWLTENAAGIAAYNAQVDTHGAFADRLRAF